MLNEFARPLGLGLLVLIAGFGTAATESWLPALVLSVVVASLFLDYWLSLIGLPCLALAGWLSSQIVMSRGPVDATLVGLLTGVAILASATGLAAARLAGASLTNNPRGLDSTGPWRSSEAERRVQFQTQDLADARPFLSPTSTLVDCPVCKWAMSETLRFSPQFLEALRNEMRSEEQVRYLQAMQTIRVALHRQRDDNPDAPTPRSLALFRTALALLDREPADLPLSKDREMPKSLLTEQRSTG